MSSGSAQLHQMFGYHRQISAGLLSHDYTGCVYGVHLLRKVYRDGKLISMDTNPLGDGGIVGDGGSI